MIVVEVPQYLPSSIVDIRRGKKENTEKRSLFTAVTLKRGEGHSSFFQLLIPEQVRFASLSDEDAFSHCLKAYS